MRTHQPILAILLCLSWVSGVGFAESEGNSENKNAYARWENGPSVGPDYFPIAVWLQDPKNAAAYKAAGVNLYIGLWKGPTEEQLVALKSAGMPVICSQIQVGLAHRNDRTIVGWMHPDEPDNAQEIRDPNTGKQTYGPPVPPAKVVERYEMMKKNDPTRPIFLNLGQGVANDEWKGRGSWGKKEDYLTYVKGCDLLSYDVYPVAGLEKPKSEDYLWYVPKGVQRLVQWSEGKKIVWNCIECTYIGNEKVKASPHQVRAEVWMSIIHGSMGIVYFVHQFKPKFDEHALLDDPEMLAAVTRINRQIQTLAPVLNRATLTDAVTVRSSNPETPIACMAKRHQGSIYLFAVGMRNQATTGNFSLSGMPASAKVELLDEERRLELHDGVFQDAFAPYDVHLYRIADGPASTSR